MRRWGVNFLIAGYVYTEGGVSFDGSLPLTNPNCRRPTALLAYARVLDLWGKSAKLDIIAPFSWLSGSADYEGQSVQRKRIRFQRSRVPPVGQPLRCPGTRTEGVRALPAGPDRRREPAGDRAHGQYDDTRIINLGTNRWSFKPQVGVSKALGRWTLEGTAAVTLFTDNNDFYGGNDRSQDPLYSLGAHAIYSFRSGIWGSLDGTYFAGGRTTLNGTLNNDLQQNWRVGATLAFP